jgi:carbonic anhydrase
MADVAVYSNGVVPKAKENNICVIPSNLVAKYATWYKLQSERCRSGKTRESFYNLLNTDMKNYVDTKIVSAGKDGFLSLLEGNERHVERMTKHNSDRKYKEVCKFITNGQKPFLTVLTCSDSRVKVSRIFDKKDGRIFDVKIAGNIAYDKGVLASLEYGVLHAHTPLLMILGHECCGAISATCSHKGHSDEGHISYLLEMLNPVAQKAGYDIDSAILLNIFETIEHIRSNSNILYGCEKNGLVSVIPAYYSLTTGRVSILEQIN